MEAARDASVIALRRTSCAIGVVVAVVGALLLAAWGVRLSTLTHRAVRSVAMGPRAAMALLACGVSLAALAPPRAGAALRTLGRAFAGFAAGVAGIALLQRIAYAAAGEGGGWVRILTGAGAVPGRMSVGNAVALLLMAAALLALDTTTRTGRHPSWALALTAGLVPLQAVVAWLYGVEPTGGESPFTQVSAQAGSALALLCAGILLARPEHGFVRVVLSGGGAGFTARRLLVAIVLLPIALGWLFVVGGSRLAQYQAMVGVSLVVLSAIATGVVVVWFTVSEVQRMDDRRSDVERALREEIAQRERAEQERAALLAREREARADAEAANRTKDEFIATLSHELRTPLNSVLGWARLLRSGKLDRDGVARAVSAVERGATTQAQIVDDLLDMARIVRGQLRLDVRPVDLGPVIEAALETVRPAASARGITIGAALDPRLPTVPGDPGRLQQIAWNLLSNAIKFTPPGGRVDVRLERSGGDVAFTVRDTGIGITPEFAPHVFERFRQADSSTTRAHGGLGLGLAIVRHLVEAHGGTVSMESEGAGKGATFRVAIPIVARSDPRAGQA